MRKFVISLFIAGYFFNAGALFAEEKIAMDFANVDISVVVKYISDLTGRNFIIDEKVRGKVTIVSPRKVGKKEAYKVFESILEVYGFAAIPSGSVTKIVPLAEARQKGGSVRIGDTVPAEMRDSMVTQLIPLKHLTADNLVAIIRPLISPTSFITAYVPSNTVILVDLASNSSRILRIIRELDVEGTENQAVVRKLEHASAKEIAKKISTLLSAGSGKGKGKGAQAFKVLADDRINALIIFGNEPHINRVNSLVDKLDVEAPAGRANINVVYLKNAVATDLEKVINSFVSSSKKTSGKKGGKPQSAQVAKGDVVVTADKATNSLLITASPEDFATIKGVIDKLDIRRRQVFVEALIFEISSDDSEKFGVEWRTTSKFTDSGVQGFGGTNFGSINSVSANPFSAGTGLVLGVVNGLVSFNGTTYANIGALISALETESGINILSTPNILTTDNEEAEIFVGENVPFIKSSAQTTAGLPVQNIERQDVGIKLRIKPQITENDYVRLSIFQEISSIRPTVIGVEATDIITTKRSVRTTVVVKDKQNIIIGGLIKDDYQDTIKKVPILGDIPILGWLFKSKEKVRKKTNLLIFLTPHIINSTEDMEKITDQKRDFMEKLKEEERKPEPDLGRKEEKPLAPDKQKEIDVLRRDVIEKGEEVVLFGGEEKKRPAWARYSRKKNFRR